MLTLWQLALYIVNLVPKTYIVSYVQSMFQKTTHMDWMQLKAKWLISATWTLGFYLTLERWVSWETFWPLRGWGSVFYRKCGNSPSPRNLEAGFFIGRIVGLWRIALDLVFHREFKMGSRFLHTRCLVYLITHPRIDNHTKPYYCENCAPIKTRTNVLYEQSQTNIESVAFDVYEGWLVTNCKRTQKPRFEGEWKATFVCLFIWDRQRHLLYLWCMARSLLGSVCSFRQRALRMNSARWSEGLKKVWKNIFKEYIPGRFRICCLKHFWGSLSKFCVN